MIITFLIILFVQGLNCFLEIGFLANNLEEANLRKYRIVGNQMMRKLNTSLIFGKPLAGIDHNRLLSNITPSDVENVYIVDAAGNLIYSVKKGGSVLHFRVYKSFFNEKDAKVYRIFFPLSDRTGIKGNLVIEVSNQEVKEKRLDLIQKSVLNFLVILAVSLPVLYGLLTFFINRPYKRFIKNIERWFDREEYDKLMENHIDLSPLNKTQAVLKKIRSGDWLSPENLDAYEDIEEGAGPAKGGKGFEIRFSEQLKNLMRIN